MRGQSARSVTSRSRRTRSATTDWRLASHLLPFFGHRRLDAIDADLCLAFKAHKLCEASELRAALDVGADIRDPRGRRAVPLAPASIRQRIDTLAAILDDAIEDGHIDHNPDSPEAHARARSEAEAHVS